MRYINKIISGSKMLKRICLVPNKFVNYNLLNYKETIQYAKKNNLGIIRWGDGETLILEGKDIHYQDYVDRLGKELDKILYSYSNESRYILCMPNNYLNLNIYELIKTNTLRYWINTRYICKNRLKKELVYGDAFLFGKNRECEYDVLWRDSSDIIFIHSQSDSLKLFKSRYPTKNIYFIKIREKNCYMDIDNILERIKEIIIQKGLSKSSVKVLISAGPCGKVLVYKLLENNIVAYDTGHCWCEPLPIYKSEE